MFFKPKTVDAAIASLLRAAHDLDDVANTRNEKLSQTSEEITRLEAIMEADQLELTRAEAVAQMIRNITEPTKPVAKEQPDASN